MKIFCICLFVFGFFISCNPLSDMMFFSGNTMGTEYHVKIIDPASNKNTQEELKTAVDSLLVRINSAISTYEPNSLISTFNKTQSKSIQFSNADSVKGLLPHFFNNLEVGKKTYDASNGFFDPTIMKLVNYWGFGYSGRTKIETPDTQKINRIVQSTGMDKIVFSFDSSTFNYTLTKLDSTIELDFGGIGQGYGADQIAAYLTARGYSRFLVELGGELVAKGVKPDGSKWSVGLNTPLETADKNDVFARVLFSDLALTTSGNYRNFYKSGDQTFSHTINPKTGFPERSTLLSVTLIGPNCTEIDAMATACMAVGKERCKEIILNRQMEAYFVFRDGDQLKTDMTEGFKPYLAK